MCSCSECHLCLMHYPSSPSAIWSGLSILCACVCVCMCVCVCVLFFSVFHFYHPPPVFHCPSPPPLFLFSYIVGTKGFIFGGRAVFREDAAAVNSSRPEPQYDQCGLTWCTCMSLQEHTPVPCYHCSKMSEFDEICVMIQQWDVW